jgi:hypothetical protein
MCNLGWCSGVEQSMEVLVEGAQCHYDDIPLLKLVGQLSCCQS